jgi:ubiquinone/menaquinone biosynthesis C-methylase UbiE
MLNTIIHVSRDFSRLLRRPVRRLLCGSNRVKLERDRPDKPLPLGSEHVSGAVLFATRHDYIASLPKGGICAEVGVLRGNFSAHILQTVRPDRLHLIDRDPCRHNVRQRFADCSAIEYHEGDSAELLVSFPDSYFDWIYIDAGHHYEAVRADADAASRKLKPGGVMIFNDYIIWDHLCAKRYGVVQTVNELCVKEGWKVVAFCLNAEMICDVALTRSSVPLR